MRNVKDPDPLCLAQDPTPFRLKLTRARTYNLSKLPGRSRRNASHRAAQAPGAARLPPPLRPGGGEKHRAAREERIQKKRKEKQREESGGERLEGEGGGERREMSLSEQRRAGEGRKRVGEGWVEVECWQVEERRGSGDKLPARPPSPHLRCRKVCSRRWPPARWGQRRWIHCSGRLLSSGAWLPALGL